jgi:oleate hydratase
MMTRRVFAPNTTVTDLVISDAAGVKAVGEIVVRRDGASGGGIVFRPIDRVFVTLGSMTEGSSIGAMDAAPAVRRKADGNPWTLWRPLGNNV